jgi:hypothetical protein
MEWVRIALGWPYRIYLILICNVFAVLLRLLDLRAWIQFCLEN